MTYFFYMFNNSVYVICVLEVEYTSFMDGLGGTRFRIGWDQKLAQNGMGGNTHFRSNLVKNAIQTLHEGQYSVSLDGEEE